MEITSERQKKSKSCSLPSKSSIKSDYKLGSKRIIEEGEVTVKKKKTKLEKIKKTKKNDTEIANPNLLLNNNEEKGDNVKEEIKSKEKSKRQLKKEKAEVRATEAKEINKKEIAQKAINYVLKWKHAKNEWKFEKLRQIWLIDNILNDEYIEDHIFTIILEYFEKCKGFAKQKLIDVAMTSVKKFEDSIEDDVDIIETKEYRRARQLLQFLSV